MTKKARTYLGVAYLGVLLALILIIPLQIFVGPLPYPSPFITLDLLRLPTTIGEDDKKAIREELSERLKGLSVGQRFDYFRSYGFTCGVAHYTTRKQNVCHYDQPIFPVISRGVFVNIADGSADPGVTHVGIGLTGP